MWIWQKFPKIWRNLSNFCDHKIENENPAHSELEWPYSKGRPQIWCLPPLTLNFPCIKYLLVFFLNIEPWLVTTHYCMQETWGNVKQELSSLWSDILALVKWPIYLLVSLSQKHTNNPPGFTLHIRVGMIHYTTDLLMPLQQQDVWKMHSYLSLIKYQIIYWSIKKSEWIIGLLDWYAILWHGNFIALWNGQVDKNYQTNLIVF